MNIVNFFPKFPSNFFSFFVRKIRNNNQGTFF